MLYSRKGGSIFHQTLDNNEELAHTEQKNLRTHTEKVSLFFTTKKK